MRTGVVAGEGLQVLGHARAVGNADSLAGQRREVVEHHAFHKLAGVGLLVALELGAEIDDAGQVVVAHKPRQILLARLVKAPAADEFRRRDATSIGRRHAAQIARVVHIQRRGLFLVDALLFRGHSGLLSR